MEVAFDTNLFRVDSNIFHATKDIKYPPLFKLFLDMKSYYETNSDIESLDSNYMIFKYNIDSFDQSYNFDTPTFISLVNTNVDFLEVIDNTHQFYKDLLFLKSSISYRINSLTFLEKLKYQLMLFSQNQKPTFDLSQLIKNRDMNKESLSMSVFMNPIILDDIKDREYYLTIINNIEDGEELFPIKDKLINSISNFHSTTNADLVMELINIIQQTLTIMLDSYITSKFDVILSINLDITDTGKTETFDNKLEIMESLVSQLLIEEISVSSQSVSYATNNSAQNLPVRNEQLTEDIILLNLDNESKSNTSIVADNTNKTILLMKINNIEMSNENDKILLSNTELDSSNSILESETSNLNTDPNYTLQEEQMVIERINIENNTQQISVSTSIIKTKSLEQNVLMNDYKKVLGQNKEANSTLVRPLKSLNKEASDTMTNTDAVMNISRNNINSSNSSMDGTLIALSAITLALVATEYPNKTIETGFSLLQLPIQAVLNVTNGLICILEALQCLAIGLVEGIIELAVYLTDLETAQFEFDNLDDNILQLTEDLKTSTSEDWNNNIFASNCSAISEASTTQKAEVEELLQEDAEMVIDWNPASTEACEEWASTIPTDVIDLVIAEFVLFVDTLKSDMQTTIDNMLGLLDISECEAINLIPDLNLDTEFGGIEMIDITFPDLKFPDFKIDISEIDLKVKPC